MLNRITVPVSASAYQGTADLQGMLSFDGRRLTLGFQTADALLGLIKSKTKQVHIEMASLDHIEYGHGWFWLMPYMRLQCNNFAAVVDIPGSESGQLKLSVRFGNRMQAKKLVEAVRFARAEALHDAINEDIAKPLVVDRNPQLSATAEAVEEMPPPPPKQTES